MNTTKTASRQLGRSGIEISPMGLGCWAMGGPFQYQGHPSGWGEVDDNESIRGIHRALDLGINFLDTSDVYGAGHSERVIGKALAGKRDQVVIATKFGNTFNEETREATGVNVSPDYIREACEASLRRMNTDYIDLYQFHRNEHPLHEAGAIRDVLEALVAEGKIRSYGWSTDFTDRARFFAQGSHCAAIQQELNVFTDKPEMIALCEEHNLASINRGPLGMGILTGKFTPESVLPRDDVRGNPDADGLFKGGKVNPIWFDKIDAIREILTSSGRTLAQGALAWLWGRSEKNIPIPGFRTVAQVEENAGAMKFGPLTPDQMREIDALLSR